MVVIIREKCVKKKKSKMTRIQKTNNLKFKKTVVHHIRTTCKCELCEKFKNYGHKKRNYTDYTEEEVVIGEGYGIDISRHMKNYLKNFMHIEEMTRII